MATSEEIEKQAREATTARVQNSADATAVAVAVARELIVNARAGKLGASPAAAFAGACAGALSAVMLAQGDVTACAMRLLRELPDASATQDPMKTMGWIMEGIAKVAVMAGAETRDAIESRIEADFMGAGAVFRDLCAKQAKLA